ncbi:MAG: hypothetical protein ACR2N1_09075 [Rubripirellula sp.]
MNRRSGGKGDALSSRLRKLDAARAYADASKVWKRSTSSFATPQYKVKNFGANQASPKMPEMSNYFSHKVKNTPTRLTSFVSNAVGTIGAFANVQTDITYVLFAF